MAKKTDYEMLSALRDELNAILGDAAEEQEAPKKTKKSAPAAEDDLAARALDDADGAGALDGAVVVAQVLDGDARAQGERARAGDAVHGQVPGERAAPGDAHHVDGLRAALVKSAHDVG